MILLLLATVAGAMAVVFLFFPPRNSPGKKSSALERDRQIYSAYSGSASCRECHVEAYDNWAKSHHALAERLPDAKQEDAAFVPARTFKHGTQQTSLRKSNGHFKLITAGLHGTNEIFPVARILAENPLRQMLVPFPGGRLQATEAAWDPRSNEWFNVCGTEDRKPGEWGHWTGRGMNWNSMCATCHNTRVRKNYDVPSDSYHTAMVENGVGCESCHGPMRSHNDWQHAHKNSSLKDPTVRKLTRDEMFSTGEAVKELEVAVKLAPDDAEFHYKLALAYNELGETEKVLTELETAVKLNPRHARAEYNLGLARNAAGNPTGAIQALLTAETADPRDPRIPYARATIHAQLGQMNAARQATRRALELNPNFTEAAVLLKQLQTK